MKVGVRGGGASVGARVGGRGGAHSFINFLSNLTIDRAFFSRRGGGRARRVHKTSRWASTTEARGGAGRGGFNGEGDGQRTATRVGNVRREREAGCCLQTGVHQLVRPAALGHLLYSRIRQSNIAFRFKSKRDFPKLSKKGLFDSNCFDWAIRGNPTRTSSRENSSFRLGVRVGLLSRKRV